jgi:hypothetical protein
MHESNSNGNSCINCSVFLVYFPFTILNTHLQTIHQCQEAIAEVFVGWSHDHFCTVHCSCQSKSGFELCDTLDVGGLLQTTSFSLND